ncbi:helix-turn-helix domain-containing protein [Agrobacterium salinitolerans]|uniref:helix-turn-helix domain-containing protein n=1 Tax=Agrobacterium salinitolerans TaxID=1183413 RepID=UPI003FD288B8
MNEERLDLRSNERWCVIPSLSAFEASSFGRVRCAAAHTLMKSYVHKTGYIYIILPFTDDTGKARSHTPRQVHRLVLEAFSGPCPPHMEALHLNDTPTDNSIDNLQWNTKKANGAARRRADRVAWRTARDEARRGIDIAEICKLYTQDSPLSEIAKASGCGIRTVKRVLKDAGLTLSHRSRPMFDPQEIVKLHTGGFEVRDIAEHLGCSGVTVYNALCKAGMSVAGRWEPIDRAQLIRLHVDGMTNTAISKVLGCCPETVARILDELRKDGLIGSVKRAARPVVDGDKVRELASHGMTNKEIAAAMSVSQCSVSKYLRDRKSAFQQRVTALHSEGKTATDIAHMLECKLSKVQYVLRKAGLGVRKSRYVKGQCVVSRATTFTSM